MKYELMGQKGGENRSAVGASGGLITAQSVYQCRANHTEDVLM